MAILSKERLKEIFKGILERVQTPANHSTSSQGGRGTSSAVSLLTKNQVAILCSGELDSICAAKILTHVLISQSVPFKLIPVVTYTSLDAKITELKQLGKASVIVLINCGGRSDIPSLLNESGTTANGLGNFANPDASPLVVIIDNSRPIHHANLCAPEDQVIVVADKDSVAGYPTLEEFQEVCRGPEETPDDSSVMIEDDRGSRSDVKSSHYSSDFRSSVKDSGEGESNEDPEEKGGSYLGKRTKDNHKGGKSFEKSRKRIRSLAYKIEKYYGESHTSLPSGMVVFSLAKQLGLDTDDMHWYSILSLSDLLIRKKIDTNSYAEQVRVIRADLSRLPQKLSNLDKLELMENETEAVKIHTHRVPVGSIIESSELNFFLMRYNSLVDACKYSPYMFSKLKLFGADGIKSLENLFAQIGIPLGEAQQQYQYMNKTHRQNLKTKIIEFAQNKVFQVALHEIALDAFVKQLDNDTQVSSMDMASICLAVLDSPINISGEIGGAKFALDDSKEEREENLYRRAKTREDNFYAVYEKLLTGDRDHFKTGVSFAIQYQKNLFLEAQHAIDNKLILRSQGKGSADRYIRLCQLGGAHFNSKFLTPYLAAERIGNLLLDIYGEFEVNQPPRRMVVSVRDSVTKRFTLVGLIPINSSFNFSKKSTFGREFRQIAEQLDKILGKALEKESGSAGLYSTDLFDQHTIELAEKAYEQFAKELIETNSGDDN